MENKIEILQNVLSLVILQCCNKCLNFSILKMILFNSIRTLHSDTTLHYTYNKNIYFIFINKNNNEKSKIPFKCHQTQY